MQTVVQNLRNVIKLVAVVAILVGVYLFGTELGLQRDMTEANIYSLTERSKSIASSIERSTTLYFFHTPQQGKSRIDPERVRTLLKQYARTNEKITFKEVDHTQRPNLARQHKIQSNNTVLIKSGQKTRKIGQYDMVKFSGRRRRSRKFKGESAMSTALLKMTRVVNRTIYLATGHGEYTRQSAREGSISRWVKGLQDEGYSVKDFNPFTDNFPDTRDMIVLVGASKAYSGKTAGRLAKWNKKGGNLLIAAGPRVAPSLNPLTEPVGLTFSSRYIIDPDRRVQTLQSLVNPFVFAPVIESHPAVKAVKEQGLGVQMGRATSLSLSGDTAQAILKTSGQAYGKPAGSSDKKISAEFNPRSDVRGPFTVGALASAPHRGRLLAFGSPTLFGNSYLGRAPGNEDFAINLINWVFDRDVSLGIRSTPSDYNRVTVPANQAYFLQVISLGLIPFGIIIWGGLVWWNRKNR
ncbi:MAG: DUF4350 domain-containing protein [bacterium]